MTTTYEILDGDWVMDASTGRPRTVADGTKLSQDLLELFAVNPQPNGFGAGLDAIIGTVPASPVAFALNVQLLILRGVDRLVQLQRRQFVQRPATERIVRVRSFSATPFVPRGAPSTAVDPTALYVTLDVATASNEAAGISGVVS